MERGPRDREEVYTLALEATLALGPSPTPVDVLGTDISLAALAAAAAARYRERAVRLLARGSASAICGSSRATGTR